MEKLILDEKYIYGGMYGANWYSYENNVVVGTVRIIDNILHTAWNIRRKTFQKDEVCWSRIDGKFGRSK